MAGGQYKAGRSQLGDPCWESETLLPLGRLGFHNTPQPLVGQTIEASGSWQRSGCGTNIPLWESVTWKNGGAEHGSESVPPLEVKEASEGRGVLTAAAGIPSGSMLDTVLYSHLNYSFNKHPRPSEDQEYGRERCQHDPPLSSHLFLPPSRGPALSFPSCK